MKLYIFTEHTGDNGDTLRLPLWHKHFGRHRSVSKGQFLMVTAVSSFGVGFRNLEMHIPLVSAGSFPCAGIEDLVCSTPIVNVTMKIIRPQIIGGITMKCKIALLSVFALSTALLAGCGAAGESTSDTAAEEFRQANCVRMGARGRCQS